jgi:hypothetical protein
MKHVVLKVHTSSASSAPNVIPQIIIQAHPTAHSSALSANNFPALSLLTLAAHGNACA